MTTLVVCPSATSLGAVLDDPRLSLLLEEHRSDVLVELRIDRMPSVTPASLQDAAKRLGPDNVIVTCRSKEEGGGLAGIAERSLDAREALWHASCAAQVAYVDIERRTLAQEPLRFAKRTATKLIVSDHDFVAMPPLATLRAWRQQSEALGADIVKQAVLADCADTLLDGMALAQETTPWRAPLSFIGMGPVGLFTRLLAARSGRGPALSYVALDEPLAAGQISFEEATQLYALQHVTQATPVYAVLGYPVTHSRSPQLHNRTLRAAQRDGIYVALSCRGDAADFLERAQPLLNLQGISVTQPHKRAVLRVCDRSEPLAERARAANTLFAPRQTVDGVRWHADNTDGPGGQKVLASALPETARAAGEAQVLVLGAGGAARTLGAALAQAGFRLVVAARRQIAAHALAQDLGGTAVVLDDTARLREVLRASDVVVQCTPVGTAPAVDDCLLSETDLALLPAHAVVFETVYTPPETLLLRRARERGLQTRDGLALLRAQGDLQAQRFYGIEALAPQKS